MADPNTIRILELDGGGARGYFSLCWLEKFVNQWGINPEDVAKNFDIICGTSVGGMMALSLAYGLTPDNNPTTGMFKFFTETAPYIFSLSSLIPSWTPNLPTKVGLILADIPFYQSSGPTADSYGYGLLVKSLEDTFGTDTLQNLKTNVVIPSYRTNTKSFVLFSNINNGRFIGQNALIKDVALATGSPPVYMPSWSFNGNTYIDGGVYQNNPAAFGLTLGKIMKPNAKRVCILSLGTGLGEIGFDPEGSNGIPLANNPLSTSVSSSTVTVTVPTTSILTNGQNVTISGATPTGGIAAVDLNITAPISIINSSTFSYSSNGTATSSTTGGGSSVVLDYIDEPSFMLNMQKKTPFYPSGISYNDFQSTPVYEKLLLKNPQIEKKIRELDFSENKSAAFGAFPEFNTIQSIFGLFEIASVGGQESVAEFLLQNSLYTLDQLYYYRFNTIFDPLINTELDSTSSETYNYYVTKAEELFNNDNINISNFIGHLTA